MRIPVLAMLFGGTTAILNGKFRAMMQTPQTKGTSVLYPDRLTIPHLNRLYRTFRRTKTTAYAAVFQMQVLCLSGKTECDIAEETHKVR